MSAYPTFGLCYNMFSRVFFYEWIIKIKYEKEKRNPLALSHPVLMTNKEINGKAHPHHIAM